MSRQVPQEILDPNIVSLVNALNKVPGVATTASCGGHENPNSVQYPAGTFYVKFDVSQDKTGWFAVEFLAWAINKALGDPNVVLYPMAPEPWLNGPGKCLSFMVLGLKGADPEKLADLLQRVTREHYVHPYQTHKGRNRP